MDVYLKHPDMSDCARFSEAASQSTALHHPWVSPPVGPVAFQSYLARIRADNQYGFLLCRKPDDALLGVFNLNEVVRGCFESAYLAYYVFEPHSRRGYMTRGLQLVMKHAFTSLALHRLEANIQPENTASIALAKRCGFQKEGYSKRYLKIDEEWRDHERYAILKEMWRQEASASPDCEVTRDVPNQRVPARDTPT